MVDQEATCRADPSVGDLGVLGGLSILQTEAAALGILAPNIASLLRLQCHHVYTYLPKGIKPSTVGVCGV